MSLAANAIAASFGPRLIPVFKAVDVGATLPDVVKLPASAEPEEPGVLVNEP